MMATAARSLSAGIVLVAVVAGALAVGGAAALWPGSVTWALAGWGGLAGVGLVESYWLHRYHGRPGSGFLAALVAGTLARAVLVGCGTAWALMAGGTGLAPFLSGAVAGFGPLMAWEIAGFMKAARSTPVATPDR